MTIHCRESLRMYGKIRKKIFTRYDLSKFRKISLSKLCKEPLASGSMLLIFEKSFKGTEKNQSYRVKFGCAAM